MATQGQALDLTATKTTLAARLARAYVYFLLIVEILLFAASVLLHISIVMGVSKLYLKFGRPLAVAAFLSNIPGIALVKERNIWRNELKSCPVWVRDFVLLLTVYVFSSLASIVFFPANSTSFTQEAFFVTGLPLVLETIPLFVLYSVLWTGTVSESELINRARSSIITTAVVALLVYARIHFQPHAHQLDKDFTLPRNPL